MLDTIAAIATAQGRAAIGIVRLSGERALPIASSLLSPLPAEITTHRQYRSNVVIDNQPIDDCIFTYAKAPRSYTGEDTVEIALHGNPLILDVVLEAVIKAGARLANGGEFTKRALLNDKLDLSQAESVIELINARSLREIHLIKHRLDGGLGEKMTTLATHIKHLLVLFEVELDFFEDDSTIDRAAMQTEIGNMLAELRSLREFRDSLRFLRSAPKIAIIGRPNAGKSSLFNALVGEERAIVHEQEGTTRDVIETPLYIEDQEILLLDTAGIRGTDDAIERKGIERTEAKIAAADLVILLCDGVAGLGQTEEDLRQRIAEKSHLVVINKTDHPNAQRDGFTVCPSPIWISAQTGEGMATLRGTLAEKIRSFSRQKDEIYLSERQAAIIGSCEHAIENALAELAQNCHLDIIAYELRAVLDQLGQITGKITTEDILGEIFGQFCIGK